MKSDIEIAQAVKMQPIVEIAEKLGIAEENIEQYGRYKAKIPLTGLTEAPTADSGKLILVTAINPTPAGEGKTTVSVGLADALASLGKRAVLALREPSMGPVMGLKGGAAGGGYAQVVPMDDINLHFTGDFHAITAANNLISAVLDNHIHQGNELDIDPRRVIWHRALDVNDRELRNLTIGLGGVADGVMREDHFDITVASEIMAVLCLATSLSDLKMRLGKILVAYTTKREPVTVEDLGIVGALAVVLKDAIKPNLVQTLAGTPAFVHGGPFANIAHGCNSVLATRAALTYGDYVVTEAGFGSDLGAEKFLDIKTRQLGKVPDAIVLVATIRSLKMNGGLSKDKLAAEDLDALEAGFANLKKHVENMQLYGLPVVVAINQFSADTAAEIKKLSDLIESLNVEFALCQVFEKGAEGGQVLAEKVITATEKQSTFNYLYDVNDSVTEKLGAIVEKIYGGAKVTLSAKAQTQLRMIVKNGWDKMPICVAKTPYSLSDNPKLLGRPEGFEVTIRELIPKLGAGFIVALAGNIITMPGLPKVPAALGIDIDENGVITGLF